MWGVKSQAKKVSTKDQFGLYNGFLLELVKNGSKTESYMTTVKGKGEKGWHYHKKRAANYVCLKGVVAVLLRKPGFETQEEFILEFGDTLHIPKEIATCIKNTGNSEAWLANFPDFPYDPADKDEQIDYTTKELVDGIIK